MYKLPCKLPWKLPWMSKKKHQAEMDQLHRQHVEHERDIADILYKDKKDLREVLQNFHEISLVHDLERGRWRVVLDFSPHVVMALERGNDARMMDYIVAELAHNIRRELAGLNIRRPEDVGLGRRPRTWERKMTSSNLPQPERAE